MPRHSVVERATHWLTALCFFLLTASGLGFFFSPLFNLTGILGAPQIAQFMHPVWGVIMMASLLTLGLINVRHVFLEREDFRWLAHLGAVIRGHEHDVCEVGQYNFGQKSLFWANSFLLTVLLITGLIIWRPYFAHNFSVETLRLCLLVHSWAAGLLMLAIFVHVYMVFWYKGTLRGMVRGTVTRAWAELHHPRWLRAVEAKTERDKVKKDKAAPPA
ncbi:MAG: formate dehydrogenase subunit gamma [Desulfobulbaceae bacterium]|nr:formate dehydrogenase subunit gamma [Desulfobulbaceae bacterium]